MKVTTLLNLITTLVLHLNQDYYQLYLYSILCLTRVLLSLISVMLLSTSLVDKITGFRFTICKLNFYAFEKRLKYRN